MGAGVCQVIVGVAWVTVTPWPSRWPGEVPVAGIGAAHRVGRARYGEGGRVEVVKKEPLASIVAECGTPLSMMATASPRHERAVGQCSRDRHAGGAVRDVLGGQAREAEWDELLVRSKSSEPATPVAEAVTVYEPAVALAVAVTERPHWTRSSRPWQRAAPGARARNGENDNAAGHRLDRSLGRDGEGQGIGKSGFVDRGLGRAPGHRRDGESLALECRRCRDREIQRFAARSDVIRSRSCPRRGRGCRAREPMVAVLASGRAQSGDADRRLQRCCHPVR